MSIWKIVIYGNANGQEAECCTLIVRSDTEKAAELSAKEDHLKNFPSLSNSLRAKSCGPASASETKYLPEGENVSLVMYTTHH